MRTGGKTALTVRGACLAAGLTFCLAFAQADEQVRVVIDDDAVAITSQNTSLRNVLEELSLKANLTVLSEEALDEPVTVDIHQPSLPEAIRRLLRHESYMLHQSGPDTGNGPADFLPYGRLWIFSDAEHDMKYAWTSRPVVQPYFEDGDDMINYRVLAYSNDAGERQEAMYGLADHDGATRIGYLEQGLTDPDEGVRKAAVEALMDVGGTESVQALNIVLNDPDSRMRVDAVDALGQIGGEEAIKYLQEAMADEDHIVREAAAEWLTELAWQRD